MNPWCPSREPLISRPVTNDLLVCFYACYRNDPVTFRIMVTLDAGL